ncbi:MAG: hypothetical protein QM733_00255 [Ilumatobacteraceae bacterium]
MLLDRPHAQADLGLAARVGADALGPADAIATVGTVHQVDEVPVGRHVECRGQNVVRGALHAAAAGGDSHHLAAERALLDVADLAGVQGALAAGAEHDVADRELLDGDVARRRAHRRPRR